MSFLAPEEAVLEAMLAGWVAQQRSRLLVASTVEQRMRYLLHHKGLSHWAALESQTQAG